MAAQEIGSLYIGLGFDTAVFDRQIIQIPQKIKPASDAIQKGFAGASKELDNATKSAGATRAGLQNLSFQLNDIATSLASGGSPFRVLAQQGGQIVQVFQQAGFKNIASAIVGMVTPLRALAVGAVAAGVGFAALVVKAQSNSESLRQFNLLLERTGRLALNLDVGGENARLRTLGISSDVAQAQRLAIARNPQLNPLASTQLQTLGANIGAFTGLGPQAGFQLLTQTISGGPEATIRFALSMDALTVAQAGALLSSARLTGGLKEQIQAVAALDTKLKGLTKEAMTPMKKTTDELAAAWQRFTNVLASTPAVQNALKTFTRDMEQISDFAEGKKTLLGRRNLPDTEGRPVFTGDFGAKGNRLTREQALAILDPNNPREPTLAEATAAMNTIGGQSLVNEGLAAMGFVGPVQLRGGGWPRSARQMAETSFSRRLGVGGGGGPPISEAERQKQLDVTDALARRKEQQDALNKSLNLYGVQQEASLAAEQARLALPEGARPDQREAAATAAAAAVYAKYNAELTKDNTITGMRIESERKVAAAMLESEGAAVRLNAAEQARIETLQRGGGSADLRTRQALAARGAGAETSLAQGVVAGKKDIEEAQTRVSLLGESTEYIERQIALLRVRQQVEAAGVPVAQSIVDARIAGVNKLQDELDLLARQRRVMDSIKEVAGVFESAFGRAFDSISDGTFRLRKFLGDLLKDLAKTLASSSFKRLLGGDSSEGGLIGSIAGKLFPSLLGTGIKASSIGGPLGDFGSTDLNKYAGGGSFAVGGSGSIDSQLVAFRATPGEMVQISPANSNYSSGRGEVIHINLNPSEGWVSGIADQRIVTRSGQIIDVAVKQSQRTVQRNFAGMSTEAQARTA